MTPSWTCADRTARSRHRRVPSRAAAGGIYLATGTEVRNSAGVLGARDRRARRWWVRRRAAVAHATDVRTCGVLVAARRGRSRRRAEAWIVALTARPRLRALPGGKEAVPRRPAQRLALQARVLDARERIATRSSRRSWRRTTRGASRHLDPRRSKAIVEARAHPRLLIRGPREDRGAQTAARRARPRRRRTRRATGARISSRRQKDAVHRHLREHLRHPPQRREYGERLRYNGC